jgi:HAMP domain-containing protein
LRVIGAAAAPSWIGLATAVAAAAVSAFVGVRQSRMQERLARLPHDLEREDVLTRYREPLAAAAFDLQSRLYNVLRLDFFAKFDGGDRGEEALRTTVFRLAQYFGWTELLRRDIQFLSFSEDGDTRRVAELQRKIAGRFLTDGDGTALMIWSDEQRAIGERMIVEEHGKVLCMGYATFRERCDDRFGPLRRRVVAELGEKSAHARLRDVQHLLCDLVEALDPRGLRYAPKELTRA